MATISFSATGLTARTKTITAGDTTRLLDAYRVIYGKVPDGAGGMRDRTNQEIFDVFADGLFKSIQEQVRNAEGNTAMNAISVIVLT